MTIEQFRAWLPASVPGERGKRVRQFVDLALSDPEQRRIVEILVPWLRGTEEEATLLIVGIGVGVCAIDLSIQGQIEPTEPPAPQTVN